MVDYASINIGIENIPAPGCRKYIDYYQIVRDGNTIVLLFLRNDMARLNIDMKLHDL